MAVVVIVPVDDDRVRVPETVSFVAQRAYSDALAISFRRNVIDFVIVIAAKVVSQFDGVPDEQPLVCVRLLSKALDRAPRQLGTVSRQHHSANDWLAHP